MMKKILPRGICNMEELKYPNKTHEEKVKRLNEWSKGNKQPPIKFSIIPTNRCNLNCDACPNSVARSEGRFLEEDEISKEKWMKIVEKGLDWGAKEWRILGGGEPMVRRETTLSILLKVNKESVYQDTEMITNGTLFQPGDIEKL
ncbi:MAG: radical SAM protein, partial [Candidatus Aenigmatarchaeota archaeon]